MADITLSDDEVDALAEALVPRLVPLLRNTLTPLMENPLRIIPNGDHADARALLSWLGETGLLKDDEGMWGEEDLDVLYADFIDKQRPDFSDAS